jgi:hypothetical protein
MKKNCAALSSVGINKSLGRAVKKPDQRLGVGFYFDKLK